MAPLNIEQIDTIIRSLRRQGEFKLKLANNVSESREHYMNEYHECAYLVYYFEEIKGRIFRSEKLTARINCNL